MRTRTRLAVLLIAIPMMLAWASDATADRREYILIVDRQPADPATTVCESLVWTTGNLNSIEWDDTGQVSLTGSRFVLPAGTYEARMRDPLLSSGGIIRTRLQSFPDDVTVLLGTSEASTSIREGKFSIAMATSFEFQNLCDGSVAGEHGFGNLDDNILRVVQLYRVTTPAGLAGLSEWMLVALCGLILMSAYRVSRSRTPVATG